MTYYVHITRAAEKDLKNAADDLLDEAGLKFRELSAFPGKFALVDDPILKERGIRFTLFKNYIAFYVVSEENHAIYIFRFLYEKREWITILKDHDSEAGFILKTPENQFLWISGVFICSDVHLFIIKRIVQTDPLKIEAVPV